MAFMFPPLVPLVHKGKAITDGLVGCYPLHLSHSSEVEDVSGDGRHATYVAGTLPYSSARIATEIGVGIQFLTANSNYISFGSQLFGNTSVGTISMFAKFGTIGAGQGHYMWSFGGANVAIPGLLGMRAIDDGSGTNTVFHVAYSTEGTDHLEITYSPTLSLSDGGWNHIVCAGNGTARNVFFNGTQLTMTTLPSFLADSGGWINGTVIASPATSIARSEYDGGGTPSYPNAVFADFRVYNRALSQSEISRISAGLG